MQVHSAILLVTLFSTVAYGNNIKLPKPDILEVQLAKCLLNISNRYFEDNKPVILERQIIWFCPTTGRYVEENYTTLITLLSIEMDQSLIHLNCYKEYDQINHSKPNVAILILPDQLTKREDLMVVTYNFISVIFGLYYNGAIHLVIVSKHLSKTKSEQRSIASSILSSAWENKIADAVVVIPGPGWSYSSRGVDPPIDVITWMPKDQRSICLERLDSFRYVDRWLSVEDGFKSNTNLFPVKDVTDLRGCELVVELLPDPPFGPFADVIDSLPYRGQLGVYGAMLVIVTDFCNIKLVLSLYSDNAPSVIVAPVFLMTGAGAHDSCLFSYPHFRDIVTWYVPVVPIPIWQGIIRAFSTKMWILVTTAYLLGFITFLLLAKVKHQGVDDVVAILMNTLCTYLGIGIESGSVFRGVTAVFFFTLWSFFCMQVYTAFQSVLIGFLIDPGTYPTVSSVEQLDELGFMKVSSYDFIGEIEVETEWNSYGKCIGLECWKEFSEKSKVAFLGSRYYYDTYILFSKSEIARVIDSAKDYLVSTHCKLGCIFGRRLDVLFHRLISTGISNYLLEENYRISWSLKRKELGHVTTSISLIHMQGPVYLLLFGFVLAFFVFVCELLWKSFQYN